MAKAIVLVVLLALVAGPEVLRAENHTVGGSSGWNQGINYDTWAAGETFTVGDNLEFNYDTSHSVDQVSKSDYDNCNAKPIKSYSGGSSSIILSSTGPMYFICPTLGHCASGMKLAINVVAASGGSSPATPSPPATSPPGSTGTPAASPPPPGGNGASGAFCSTFNVVLGLSLVLAMVGASMY